MRGKDASWNVKSIFLSYLLYLAERGGLSKEIATSSVEIGKALSMSQQSASRILAEMEEAGLIERKTFNRGTRVVILEKGISILREIYSLLEKSFNISVSGRVVKGMGEGSYYIREYSEMIRKCTSFRPYPGTLNILVEPQLIRLIRAGKPFCTIKRFSRRGRTFGEAYIYRAEILFGQNNAVASPEIYIVVPRRSRYSNVIEIISRHNLRKKFSLRDGENVTVKMSAP